MTGHPHPKGPEHGKVFATAEEAMASDEEPAMVIPRDQFMESLNSPEVQALLARAGEIELDAIDARELPENPCIEIDAEEFEEARRDPKVKDLLRRADEYGERMKAEGRLEDAQ